MDDDARRTASAVRRATMRLARRLRAERPRPGISLQKLSVLAHLNRSGTLSPGEVAAADHIQPQSLTRALASLEHDGLIRRTADPRDQRRARLELTAGGAAVLHADMHQRDVWLARALSEQLTPTERQLLRLASELMQRLADADAEPDAPAALDSDADAD
jgi:DNA-binding MarR family transcriptional regulator